MMGKSPSEESNCRSLSVPASSFMAREKSTERTSKRPSWLSDSFSCANEAKPLTAAKGVRAVTVGLMLKLMYDPGVALGTLLSVRLTLSWRAETDLKRFSPVCGLTPSNWAFCPPTKNARTACETLLMTWAGATGPCEKYRAPPARPEPHAYPPAVLPSVPPVKFGRSVDANGARPVCLPTASPMRDFGKDARSNLTPEFRAAEVVKRRTVAEIVLCVLYQRPLLCFNKATRCRGCFGTFRASKGCSSACVGRIEAGN